MDTLDTLDAMVNPAQHESVTDHQFDEFQHIRRKIIRGIRALKQGILWLNYLSNFVNDALWIIQNFVI